MCTLNWFLYILGWVFRSFLIIFIGNQRLRGIATQCNVTTEKKD